MARPAPAEAEFGTGKEDGPGRVESSETVAAARPIWRQWPLFLLGTLAGLALLVALGVHSFQMRHSPSRSIQSLAVLPLENLSRDPD